MRYYVTIRRGDRPFRREITFSEFAGSVQARVRVIDDDGDGDEAHEPRTVALDSCVLEGGRALNLIVGDESHDFYLVPRAGGFEVQYRGRVLAIDVEDERELVARQVHGAAAHGPREIRASMPGIVAGIDATEGSEVAAGDTLLVLEAMKMQSPIAADGTGRVARIHVKQGQAVSAGELLVTLE